MLKEWQAFCLNLEAGSWGRRTVKTKQNRTMTSSSPLIEALQHCLLSLRLQCYGMPAVLLVLYMLAGNPGQPVVMPETDTLASATA